MKLVHDRGECAETEHAERGVACREALNTRRATEASWRVRRGVCADEHSTERRAETPHPNDQEQRKRVSVLCFWLTSGFPCCLGAPHLGSSRPMSWHPSADIGPPRVAIVSCSICVAGGVPVSKPVPPWIRRERHGSRARPSLTHDCQIPI